MLLLARESATKRPRAVSVYYQQLTGAIEERLCVRKSLFVFWRPQLFDGRLPKYSCCGGISQHFTQLGGKDLHGKRLVHQYDAGL